MEAAMDDLDDGSIPDLTEVCVSPDNPHTDIRCCKQNKRKDSNNFEKCANSGSKIENKFKESRKKLQNTRDRFYNGIKTAMNNTNCFDDSKEIGRMLKLTKIYCYRIFLIF